jgi:hypothetical protein
MSNLLGAAAAALLRLFWGIRSIFGFLEKTEQDIAENSRIGESPLDRRLRDQRRFWYWVLSVLIFLTIVGAVGLFVLLRL